MTQTRAAGAPDSPHRPAGPRTTYGQRLTAVLAERGPLCVGVDPHPKILTGWGLSTDVSGLERCARGTVAALADTVGVFKPQSAFFEAYGSAGIAVLERVLADIRAAGALSILDAKRGDIGSTMDAYAAAYLTDGSPLAADAVTLSPYLGFGSLQGAVDLAREQGRGVYVLTLTSNPEAAGLQHAVTASGVSVAQSIVVAAAACNSGAGLGHVGLVVGATIGAAGVRAAGVDFTGLNGSILAPGIGAQGATASDLVDVFSAALPLVLPTSSREVLVAGPDPASLRTAARRALGQMEAVAGLG
jgi:orotidine-5'-phosphate decarboxylase